MFNVLAPCRKSPHPAIQQAWLVHVWNPVRAYMHFSIVLLHRDRLKGIFRGPLPLIRIYDTLRDILSEELLLAMNEDELQAMGFCLEPGLEPPNQIAICLGRRARFQMVVRSYT